MIYDFENATPHTNFTAELFKLQIVGRLVNTSENLSVAKISTYWHGKDCYIYAALYAAMNLKLKI